jgi:hypothetical protein
MENKEITPREVIFPDRRTLEAVIEELRAKIKELESKGA